MSSVIKELQYYNGEACEGVVVKYAERDTKKRKISTSLDRLQAQIYNLNSRGRFLSLWNCETGLPDSFPTPEGPTTPYLYATGDYYVVGHINTAVTQNNYKPNGSSFTGAASQVPVGGTVKVNDAFYYDGTNWILMSSETILDYVRINGTNLEFGNANYSATLLGKDQRPQYVWVNGGSRQDAETLALYDDIETRAPVGHAAATTTYGVGTSDAYGHVRVITGDLNGKAATEGYAASQSHTHSQYLARVGNATLDGNMTINGDVTVSGPTGSPGHIILSNLGSINLGGSTSEYIAMRINGTNVDMGADNYTLNLKGNTDRPIYTKYNSSEGGYKQVALLSDIQVVPVNYTLED